MKFKQHVGPGKPQFVPSLTLKPADPRVAISRFHDSGPLFLSAMKSTLQKPSFLVQPQHTPATLGTKYSMLMQQPETLHQICVAGLQYHPLPSATSRLMSRALDLWDSIPPDFQYLLVVQGICGGVAATALMAEKEKSFTFKNLEFKAPGAEWLSFALGDVKVDPGGWSIVDVGTYEVKLNLPLMKLYKTKPKHH